ncbi:hypothetical protein PI125_g3454 [Phytophthora idaei]|nr:hypothetical protein PI125_g3454 [Phytophthora idaei]
MFGALESEAAVNGWIESEKYRRTEWKRLALVEGDMDVKSPLVFKMDDGCLSF